MGPKVEKKKLSPAPRSKSPKKENTDTSYFGVNLNEDDWKISISMILPSNEFDELYIEQLEKSVKSGYRRRFTWFSKKELIELINENATGKKPPPVKKPGQLPLSPQFIAAIDAAKLILDNKEPISDNLIAQLIKAKLIYIKAVEKEKEAIRLSREEKKDPAKAGAKKEKSPTGKKSPTKIKKPAGPLPDIEKQSQLKKRDEDDDDKYIDDEPRDGPQHYVILSGFYSSKLLKYIDDYQIPIDSIIKFKSPNPDRIRLFISQIEEREKIETNLKANLKLNNENEDKEPINVEAISEERQAQLNQTKQDLEKFWNEVNQMLDKSDDKSLLQHIARLKFNLKQDPNIKSWFEVDPKIEFSDKMFNEIAQKLYTLVIQKRQYNFYINNLKLYSIPNTVPSFQYPLLSSRQPASNMQSARDDLNASFNAGRSTALLESDKFYDTRYYNELMNSVPAEYISTSIILHCMIEQIVATDEKKTLPSEINNENAPQLNNLSQDISRHLCEMVNNLALEDKEAQSLGNLLMKPVSDPNQSKKKTSSNTPFLINYHDEVGVRLKGVFEDNSQKKTNKTSKLPFDPIEVETEMLTKSVWTAFAGLPYISAKMAKERAARLQELLHFCSTPEITNADVDRAFKQFVFETMNLTETNRKNFIKRNERNIVIPWDDPYPNITATLTEEQQIYLKSLNIMEAKKELMEKKNNRILSGSTTKSIKFNESEHSSDIHKDSSGISSILKSRPSTKLSVQSVHFPDTFEANTNEQLIDVVPTKNIDQTVEMIYNTKKRDLNDWNISEHYEPKILVQVLQKASYTHPYVDSYYNRRDNSLLLVFSNPFDENSLNNNEEWTIKLHSNVGFRNYLEKIYDMIIDWTRDEEAKYQASLVAKEVDKFRSESSMEKDLTSSRPSSKTSKKGGSTSPDKGKKKEKEKGKTSPISVEETNYITDKFMGHNSLKSWKLEQEKLKEESGVKDLKKPKSPPKGGTKSPGTDVTKAGTKNSQRPKSGSQSPSKSTAVHTPKPGTARTASPKKTSRSDSKSKNNDRDEKSSSPTHKSQKANNAFIGYDVGNNMIHLKTNLNHMFPSNGALIKTERHVLKTGNKSFITTTVAKDGHTFSIHIVDPKSEEELNNEKLSRITKESYITSQSQQNSVMDILTSKDNQSSIKSEEDENPESKSIAKYTCLTGVFDDGFTISFSSQNLKQKTKKSSLSTNTPRTNVTEQISVAQDQSGQLSHRPNTGEDKENKGGKKSAGKKNIKGKDSTVENQPSQTSLKQPPSDSTKKTEELSQNKLPEIKEEPSFKMLPWSQLFMSTPTGLSCTFLPETYAGVEPTKNYEPHRLIVKQSYSSKCDEKASEHFKNFNTHILKEKSRIIKSDGSVIRFMNDNSTEIYYPNGTIYRKQEETVQDTEVENLELVDSKDKNKKDATKKKDSNKVEEPIVHFETKVKTKWTLITPSGREYLVNQHEKKNEPIGFHRSIQGRDIQTGEVMVSREDNLKIVYRPDGSSLVEFEDGTRITTFYAQNELILDERENLIYTDSKKEKYIKIECPGFASTIFNSKTSECTLAFGNGTLVSCDPKKMLYNITYGTGELLDINQEGYACFIPRNSPENSKNKFLFTQNSNIILEHEDDDGHIFRVTHLGKTFISTMQNLDNQANPRHSKSHIRTFNKHSPRFFVIHKNSSGTELLRYEDVAEYMSEVEVDPMTAIIRDNVQGYPTVMGTTVLRPLKNCLTDTWLCEYDEKDVTPPGLRCRNLITFPPNPEVKVLGPKFGTNIGRSLQIEVDVPRRVKNPPLVIAKRMEYRQLIEYQKLNDTTKSALTLGLKNYMKYIAERAENHRLLLTHDPRTEIEKLTAIKILQIARPDHLFKADITSLYRNALLANSGENFGKNLKIINKLIVKSKSKRYENLQKEILKEKANKEIWRNLFVPPYFESEWGKLYFENNISPKESNFLQTSENFFSQNEPNSKETQSIKENIFDEQAESKITKKKSLPPISMCGSPISDKKSNLFNKQMERYQPNFKHSDRLDPKKLPNSIKTTRPNAIPNITFLTTEEPVRRKIHNSIVQASIANGKPLEKRRGCEIYPHEINFGILREGFTYVVDFELINAGIDSCRFKLKHPEAETGLKIMYKPGPIAAGMKKELSIVFLAIYKSETDIVEQISPKIRQFIHNLEITTETETIILPIYAEIATAEEFRNMFRGNLEAGKNERVRILSVRPTSTRDVLTKPLTILNSNKKQMIKELKSTNKENF